LDLLKLELSIKGGTEEEWAKTIKYCDECHSNFLASVNSGFRIMDVTVLKVLVLVAAFLVVLISIIIAIPGGGEVYQEEYYLPEAKPEEKTA